MTKAELLAALKKGQYQKLDNASDEFINDFEIIKIAIENGKSAAIKYAGEKIKNDKNIILKILNLKKEDLGLILEFLPEDFRNDREIVKASVIHVSQELLNPLPLEFASKSLQDDKEIVMQAVIANGRQLQYASDKLKNEREIVLEAIKSNPDSIEYVGTKVLNDKSIMLQAVKNDSYSIKYVSDELRNDEEIILTTAADDFDLAMEYVGEKLKNNKEFMKKMDKFS